MISRGGYTIGWVLFPNLDRTVDSWWPFGSGKNSWDIDVINKGITEVYSDNMAI